MAKTKVLFITPSLCQGGIEHSLITMLKLIDEDKFDITLYLYGDDNVLLPLVPNYVKVIVDQDTNHYYRRPKAIIFTLLKAFHKKRFSENLRKYIRKQRALHPMRDLFKKEFFDVAVSYTIGLSTKMVSYIKAKKKYVFFHSSVDLHHEMLEREFPKYDGIVAVSQGVKEMLQREYPMVKEKVMLLQNYVDAENVLQKAQKTQNVINIDKDVVNICSCGRLSPEKGFDMAVEAAAILRDKGCNFKWYFIGDGSERKKVEEIIEKYSLENKVYITGYVDNPFPLMKESDIYVQPSYEESYGMTIKEAMILGCPVISTATVGGKTLIDDGNTGILTTIDAQGLANGIMSMIDNRELQDKCRNLYSGDRNQRDKEEYIRKVEKLLTLGE